MIRLLFFPDHQISAIRLLLSFVILIMLNFLQELSLHSHLSCLVQEPSFLAFDMPPSLNLVISSFWFKVRDIQLFLPLEHWESIVGMFTGLIAVLLCLKGQGGPRRGYEMGEWLESGADQTHTTYVWARVVVHQPQWWHKRPVITDCHNKHNNENVWNTARITKIATQKYKVNKCCWEKWPQ